MLARLMIHFQNTKLLTLFAALLFLAGCNTFKKVPKPVTQGPPLVVFFSIDQMRYDYLERFDELYTGGFRRLLDEGAVFSNAHYLHAHTATAPGHATLSTGCHPSAHGVVNNNFYVQQEGETVYCVTDKSTLLTGIANEEMYAGGSPYRLMRPALGDWLKKQNRKSKVFGVSLKDRSAILLAGQKPDGAFWFDERTTHMVSSDYYSSFPDWAENITGEDRYGEAVEQGWYKKMDDAAYNRSRMDDFAWETNLFPPSFPHTIESFLPPANRFPALQKKGMMMFNSPFGDAFMFDFARELMMQEKLGMDEHPDILFLSASAADYIGHHFGPMSHEVQDYYLWMDEYLGNFMDFLDQQLGKEKYVLMLSSDHAVAPMPEERHRQGKEGRRVLTGEFAEALEEVQQKIKADHGIEQDFIVYDDYTGVVLNYAPARARGIYETEFRKLVSDALKEINFLVETYTIDELRKGTSKPFALQYQRSYYPGRGNEIMILGSPYTLLDHRPNGTNHGTPYDYDNHVPVIFYGAGVRKGKYNRQIGTIDVAPTIARLLHINIPDGVDGKPINEILPAEKVSGLQQ